MPLPLILLISCGRGDQGQRPSLPPTPLTASFSSRNMLSQLGAEVISPSYQALAQNLKGLEGAIAHYCSKGQTSQLSQLSHLRESWHKAMLSFHRLEAYKIGPIKAQASQIALEIYSPLKTHHCSVDHLVAKGTPPEELASTLPSFHYNMKGLDTLEYLIFGLEVEGPPRCPLATPALISWKEKNPGEQREDRCRYMKALGRELVFLSTKLEEEWSSSGTWRGKLLTGESLGGNLHKSLETLFDSLFYIEIEVKDKKLAIPLGISSLCEEEEGLCPEKVEHRDSGLSLEAIAAHLEGFLSILKGGFSALLVSRGHKELAEDIKSRTQKAIDFIRESGQKSSFLEKLKAHSPCRKGGGGSDLCDIYVHVKGITDILKLQLPSILNLEPPKQGASDVD